MNIFHKQWLINIYRALSITLLVSMINSAYAKEATNAIIDINSNYWVNHVTNDLLPYWNNANRELANDSPFPSYVFDDGTRVTIERSGEYKRDAELNDGGWMAEAIGKNFNRMHARQTYAYGIAFHLTGKQEYLIMMEKGVKYSIGSGFDNNGALTVLGDRNAQENDPEKRTSQDQAYSLIGLSLYYYLTRDEIVLLKIIEQHDYILNTYGVYNEDGKLTDFLWIPTDTESVELVSILDQLNAYMVLLYPVLPAKYQEKWARTMYDLCVIMLDKFFVEKVQFGQSQFLVNSFWGSLNEKEIGGKHFDFGHTVKAWWMINLVGVLLGNDDLGKKGEAGVKFILDNGYLSGDVLKDAAKERGILNYPESLTQEKMWGEKFFPTNVDDWWVEKGISLGQHWWIHCEMDQAAAMTFKNRNDIERWVSTSKYFVKRFVDGSAGEVWHSIDPTTLKPQLMKTHLWKNAYHSFEHALIMAIATQKANKMNIDLYFAIKNGSFAQSVIKPYYFTGEVYDIQHASMQGAPIKSCKVTFSLGQ